MNNDLFQQARAAYARKDFQGALAAYTQCLQDAGSSLAPGEVGLLYHQIGNCLVKLKNPNAGDRRCGLRRVRRGELQPRHGLRLAA